MGFVANDQGILLFMIKLAAGAGPVQHLVAQVLQDGTQVVPLQTGWRRSRAQLCQRFAVFGHRETQVNLYIVTKI